MRRELMAIPKIKLSLSLAAAALLVMTMGAVQAEEQRAPENRTELATPVEPLRPGVSGDQLFSKLETQNEIRKQALRNYTALRTYQVIDLKGKVHAEEIGEMEFRAPEQKTFIVASESGSGLIRRMALKPLISSEIEAAAGKEHHDSAISPANYSLDLLGEQQVGPHHCFVAQAVPKRKDKYLFEGKLWIDADDYAVVRIEGHPAKKLSFWIESADFVRQYQKIGGFWLPEQDQTFVHVRLYGTKVLNIKHQNYLVNAIQNREAQMPVQKIDARPTGGTD